MNPPSRSRPIALDAASDPEAILAFWVGRWGQKPAGKRFPAPLEAWAEVALLATQVSCQQLRKPRETFFANFWPDRLT